MRLAGLAVIAALLGTQVVAHEAAWTVSADGKNAMVEPADTDLRGPLGTLTITCGPDGVALVYAIGVGDLADDVSPEQSRLVLRITNLDGSDQQMISGTGAVLAAGQAAFSLDSADTGLPAALAAASDIEAGISPLAVLRADLPNTSLRHGFRFLVDAGQLAGCAP